MKKIDVGDAAPTFTFECTDPNIKSFKDLLGQNIVLYFYPKDNTPGCTTEGKDFKSLHNAFKKLDAQILGVSRDSLNSHEKFCAKLGLPFPLITDPEEKLCQYFGVIIEKNMFMRKFLGIDRSTFLIDKKGKVRQVWRKVKVAGHAQAVLDALEKIN